MRALADRSRVAFDDVPDRREVHARPHDREDDPVRGDGRREEEGGTVRDHRIGRIAHVRGALQRAEEVLAEGDARAFVGRHGGGDDLSLRIDHGDRLVLGRAGRGGGEGRARGVACGGVVDVLGIADDVGQLAYEHDVAETALEVRVDRVRRRGRALADVRDAETRQVVARARNRHRAHERDGRDADDQERREDLVPEPNARPTHCNSPAPRGTPRFPPRQE